MTLLRRVLLGFGLLLIGGSVAFGLGACGDDESTAADRCQDQQPETNVACCDGGFPADGSCGSPLVSCSFAGHLVPLFERACSFSGCHNAAVTNPAAGLGLGARGGNTSATQIAEIHAGLVNADADRANGKLVVPSDPNASWLLTKCAQSDVSACAQFTCQDTDRGCGGVMPPAGALPAHEIAMIAAWIADGAPNN